LLNIVSNIITNLKNEKEEIQKYFIYMKNNISTCLFNIQDIMSNIFDENNYFNN